MASRNNSGTKNIIIIGGALLVAGAVWYYTKRAPIAPQAPVEATAQANMPMTVPGSLSAISDMQMDAFEVFATPENLKDVQDSVKYTVKIMEEAMREQKMAEDEIGLIEDLPEVDEIIKKEGWLEKDKATQKDQLQQTDTSLKQAYVDMLGGKLPEAVRAKYDAMKADGTIKYPVIID